MPPAYEPSGPDRGGATRAWTGLVRSSSGPPQRTILLARSPNMSVASTSEYPGREASLPGAAGSFRSKGLASGLGEFGDELRGVDCTEAGDEVVSALGVEAQHDVGLALA